MKKVLKTLLWCLWYECRSEAVKPWILSRTICTLLLLIPPATLVSKELAKREENDTQRFGEKDKGEEKVKGRLANTE